MNDKTPKERSTTVWMAVQAEVASVLPNTSFETMMIGSLGRCLDLLGWKAWVDAWDCLKVESLGRCLDSLSLGQCSGCFASQDCKAIWERERPLQRNSDHVISTATWSWSKRLQISTKTCESKRGGLERFSGKHRRSL